MSTYRNTLLAAAVAVCTSLAGCAGVSGGQSTSAQAAQRHKVVFQVSEGDPKKWNLALNNVKNVQHDLGAANVDVEIVAYGPGIGMIKAESIVGNRVHEALAAGVKVVACENTMHGMKLQKADMLSGLGYVPAGVVELMNKQREGYAYIRP